MKEFALDKENGLVVEMILSGDKMTLVETLDHVRYHRMNFQLDRESRLAKDVSDLENSFARSMKYKCGTFKLI